MELGLYVVIGANVIGLVLHYVAVSARIAKLEVKVCHLWRKHEAQEVP